MKQYKIRLKCHASKTVVLNLTSHLSSNLTQIFLQIRAKQTCTCTVGLMYDVEYKNNL